MLGELYAVGNVSGTGANATISRYPWSIPGTHVDGVEAWLYPIVPSQVTRLAMAAKSQAAQLVETAVLAPLDWMDERTAAVRGTKWFLFRNVPRDVSWAQTLGSAALTAFIVQTLTGVILAMYYEPSAAINPVTGKPIAYSSIEAITNDLTLGWLVRGMHRWGASVFIILLFLHMGRVFLFGAYKYPRELTWITGVLILATGMLMGFTGYLLPWDQTAYWASVVGINLNGTAPFARPLARAVPRGRAGDQARRRCRSCTRCTCC